MIKQNTLVSDNQIHIRSIAKDITKEEWGEGNLGFGMVWRENYIVLDPLVEDSFGAWFLIDTANEPQPDENAQRSALIPFEVIDPDQLCISTASESIFLYPDTSIDVDAESKKGKFYPLNKDQGLKFEKSSYWLHFQVCIGTNADVPEEEVYYRFTFIKKESPDFKVLIDDDYGWNSSTELQEGKF